MRATITTTDQRTTTPRWITMPVEPPLVVAADAALGAGVGAGPRTTRRSDAAADAAVDAAADGRRGSGAAAALVSVV